MSGAGSCGRRRQRRSRRGVLSAQTSEQTDCENAMAQPHRTSRRRSRADADRNMELVGTMKRPRQKSETHLDFVRSLPCVICGDNTSTEAAHIRMGDASIAKRPTGMGEKPSDIWAVPLCGRCHRGQHSVGESAFWTAHGIDPIKVALALWAESGDHELGEQIVKEK